ncbi:K02A2.6-like [Cordylochernes scorpioides]|uniref:K02A2.6-like n=1 Tax=Cordylochernes scorpioides TaxID=51811 RepID=A0ABY6KWA7_9ARAC|nr:K02A2.6-like [Cordylochernes scorpioides]
MTFRREWFKTYTPFTSDHPIYLGDNSTLLAEGMGDIEIQAYVDGGWYNTYIRNVLYSPQLKKNLYSLSTSTRRGFNVIIKHDKLQIFMDNDLKAVGVRHDDLYRMLFKVTSSSQGYITSENKLQLWHERLAHLPVATLREMATKGLVDGLQPQDLEGEFFFCEGCQLGKAHRKSCYPSDGKNYQLALKKIAEKCEFPDLEDRLRDALVCGILNEEIQSMLLMNSMLTFKVAQEMALAHEAAVKNVAEIKNGKPQEEMNVMGRAVKTSGRDINMLIDSGTGKNIISEKTYIETWVKSERPRIEKDSTKLVQWNRQRLSILGKIKADVKVNKINITMELLVVEGPGSNLIGREAFDQIGIGLEWINYGDSVCQITEEFMDVFKEKLGQYRGPPIHIKIKTLGKPTFLRARTLPYAIRPKVEEALRKMEEQGILTPVEFTRFATPIVPVLKRDGSIRICGDYRSTVNTIVESDTFPVPAAADLQVNLAGGKVFSKLDLKDAYQQLVVDEETAELSAINTHKGLFKWPEAIIMDHCTATATVRVLRNLFAVHGLPDQVVSDNGRMFVGHEFQEFLRMNGIRHITSAPYHPQTNGQAERVVQTLKQLIRKNGWENISVTLPRALFAMRTTPHGTTGLTPAELLMGRRLTTRMNRLHPKESEDSVNGKEHFQNRFKSQENVYAREYNGKGKWEPGKIKTVLGPRNYEVIMENGVTAKRHQDQLMRRVKEEVSEDVEKKEECNTERRGEQMNDPNESPERLEETPGPSRPIRNRRLPEYLKDCVTNWGQVFARFGLPELLVTDNGRQFVSKELEEFTKMNGIRHTKTSPYNPSTNGLAERYVREFKTSLRKNSGKDSLETNLERFLLAQRAFPQTVMKESPAELLMKRRLKTRFSNLMPKMEFKGEAFHDALKKQENFSIGSDVHFRNYAAGPKWKQGTILKLLSCRHYLIGYEDQSFKRHINQLRPVKEKPEAAVLKDPRLVLPSTSTETLENHPEMKPSQIGLEIPERKLPEMELAEKPKSIGPDLAPVGDNQSPVAVSGEKVPSRSPRPQREKPRSTRQDLAPVGDNQSPVAASGGKVPSRSPRPQRSRRPPDRLHYY